MTESKTGIIVASVAILLIFFALPASVAQSPAPTFPTTQTRPATSPATTQANDTASGDDAVSAGPSPEYTFNPADDGTWVMEVKIPLPKDQSASLATTRFYNKSTDRSVGKTLLSLLDSDGKAIAGVSGQTIDIPAKHASPVLIRVEISGLTQVGRSTAELRNFGQQVAILVAFKTLDTFSLRIEPGQEKTRFDIQADQTVLIPIRNDDASAYRVTWTLKVTDLPLSLTGTVTLDPARTTWIELKPTTEADKQFVNGVGLSGLLKPLSTNGILEIKPAPGTMEQSDSPGSSDGSNSRSALIPIAVSVNNFPSFVQVICSAVFVSIFLTLGGVCSIIVTAVAPNASKLADATELLGSTLAERIRGLHQHLGQRLGVVLRVERHRLQAVLASRRLFSPDFATVLAQVNQGATTMIHQLDLLEQADELYDRTSALAFATAPPSIVLQVEALIDQIANRLATVTPQDDDFKAAGTSIANANALLDGIARLDVNFITPLVARAQSVKDAFIGANATLWTQVSGHCVNVHSLLNILNSPFDNATTIGPPRYAFFDASLTRLLIIWEFLTIYESASHNPIKMGRLKQSLKTLVEYLAMDTWEAFRRARLLLEEMREDKYAADLIAESRRPGALLISVDPERVIAEQASTFEVQFGNALFRDLAARREIVPRWRFGDGFSEVGWSVIHFYRRSFLNSDLSIAGEKAEDRIRRVEVSVTFEVDGRPLVKSDTDPAPVEVKAPVSVYSDRSLLYFGHRARTEVFRLAIAIVAAVGGYLVTAQGQIASVNVLTAALITFAAGFGINNLKDIVAPQK